MDRRFSIEVDDELSASVAELTVVAIKDRESSKCAFKWALDNLFEYDDANKPIIVHVRRSKSPSFQQLSYHFHCCL